MSANTPEMTAKDGSNLLDKLKKLSVEEKVEKHQNSTRPAKAQTLASQYQLNYRPMPIGMRKDLWEEGYKYRNLRKKSGFNHFKLEWMLPTDRSSLNSANGARGSIKRLTSGELQTLEPLNLPPTKLEKKRLKLKRIYERALLKERPKTSHESRNRLIPKEDDPKLRRKSDNQVITSYERNRLNNLQSHITLPTAMSSLSSSGGSVISPEGVVIDQTNGLDTCPITSPPPKCDSKEVQTDLEVQTPGSKAKQGSKRKKWVKRHNNNSK